MEPWSKFILYGTYGGFSRSTLGDDNLYLVLENGEKLEIPKCFVKNASDFVEKDKLKLKNIISRMEMLNDDTCKEWIDVILYEFGERFGTLKYRDGYEQGKIEGMVEREKVAVPQFVADWIKYCKNTNVTLVRALLVEEVDFYNYANQKDSKKLKEFLRVKDNQEAFARAWLDGYWVEEKRYMVRMKGVNDYGCYLNKGLLSKKYFWESKSEIGGCRTKHTRKQLEEDNFGWVFDCEGIEIEEVE